MLGQIDINAPSYVQCVISTSMLVEIPIVSQCPIKQKLTLKLRGYLEWLTDTSGPMAWPKCSGKCQTFMTLLANHRKWPKVQTVPAQTILWNCALSPIHKKLCWEMRKGYNWFGHIKVSMLSLSVPPIGKKVCGYWYWQGWKGLKLKWIHTQLCWAVTSHLGCFPAAAGMASKHGEEKS